MFSSNKIVFYLQKIVAIFFVNFTNKKGGKMNSLSKYFKFYVLGILMAAIIFSLTHCSDENSTSPADNFGTETRTSQKIQRKVMSAFESGIKQTVLNLMYVNNRNLLQ